MQKRTDKTRSRKEISNKKKKRAIIIISAIIVILISASAAYLFHCNLLSSNWQDKVYSGVNIEGIDLSGCTKEEAALKLKQEFLQQLSNKKINISIGDKTFNYTYKDIAVEIDVEDTAEEAVQFGKSENLIKRVELIKNKDNDKHDLTGELSFDEDKISEIKDNIKAQVNVNAKDATVNINNGQVTVVPEKTGAVLDEDEFVSKFKEAINLDLTKDINLKFELKEDKPKRTGEDVSKIKDKLSSFSTNYTVGDRGSNLELVTRSLNGTILMPGEEFSYSDFTQSLRGKYKDAGGYINNKVEQVEGGGICQVSTTLYRAVMRANIRSVERHNHGSLVGYAQPGLDATVAWGYLDYRFKNTYDFPIYIEGIGGNGTITFNIYGMKEGLNGCTYDIVAENLGTDANGYTRANSYLVTYKDGKEINREFISKDTYSPLKTN